MRHQAHDRPALVTDPGDVGGRPVGIPADVAHHNPPGRLEFGEHARGRDIATIPVLHRDDDLLAVLVAAGPGSARRLDPQPLVAADEVQSHVASQCPGEQAGLAEHLKPVADAENRQARAGRRDEGRHHGREPGYRTGAQVVTVGESAGQDDGIDAGEIAVAMPEGDRFGTGGPHCERRVPVVEGAGEGDDPDPGGRGRLGHYHTHRDTRPDPSESTPVSVAGRIVGRPVEEGSRPIDEGSRRGTAGDVRPDGCPRPPPGGQRARAPSAPGSAAPRERSPPR